MQLKVVGHPRRRMEQRGISMADIESAIANCHTKLDTTRDNSITYIGPGVSGDDLKVWALPPGYVDDSTTIIVKSVAWKDQEGTT